MFISDGFWCDPFDHLWSSMYDTAWYSNLKHLRLGTISGPWKDFKGPIVRFSSTGVLLLERAFNILQLSSWTAWIWLGSLCEWVLHLEYVNFAWGGWVYGYRDTTGGDPPPCQGARTGLMHSCMLLLGMEYPPILLASSNIILYHPHLLATFIWVRIFPPSYSSFPFCCCVMLLLFVFVLGPSCTSRRVQQVAFLLVSAHLCLYFSTPVTRSGGGWEGLWGAGFGMFWVGGWGDFITFCRLCPVSPSFHTFVVLPCGGPLVMFRNSRDAATLRIFSCNARAGCNGTVWIFSCKVQGARVADVLLQCSRAPRDATLCVFSCNVKSPSWCYPVAVLLQCSAQAQKAQRCLILLDDAWVLKEILIMFMIESYWLPVSLFVICWLLSA